MATLIEMKDGKTEVILNEQDFAYLIERDMGIDAADYFRSLMEELEVYREEDSVRATDRWLDYCDDDEDGDDYDDD